MMDDGQRDDNGDWAARLVASRWFRSALGVLVVLGILARIALKLMFAQVGHPQLWEFDDIALTLLDTGVYTYKTNGVPNAYMPPGYPLVLWLLYRGFGVGLAAHAVLAGLLLCFEVATPFLVGWVAALVWNRVVGVVAFLFALAWPQFLIMSGTFSDIQLYGALLIAACGLLFSHRLSPTLRVSLSGLALGLYASFRFDAPALVLPFLCHIARANETGSQSRARRVGRAALFLVAFLVPLTPWLVRNYHVFDEIVLSTSSGFNLRRGHHESASGTPRDLDRAAMASIGDTVGTPIPGSEVVRGLIERTPSDVLRGDRIYRDMALRYIVEHPAHEVRLAGRKLFYFLVADFTHPVARLWPVWLPSLVALVLGLIFWFRTGGGDIRQQTLWLIFAAQMAVAVAFFVLPRYRMVVDFVPLVFLAGWIVARAVPYVAGRRDMEPGEGPAGLGSTTPAPRWSP